MKQYRLKHYLCGMKMLFFDNYTNTCTIVIINYTYIRNKINTYMYMHLNFLGFTIFFYEILNYYFFISYVDIYVATPNYNYMYLQGYWILIIKLQLSDIIKTFMASLYSVYKISVAFSFFKHNVLFFSEKLY